MRTSLTLRRTMRMLTSVSLAFLKKRWNVPKNFNILQTDSENHTSPSETSRPERSRQRNNRSMHSAMSRSGRSRKQATLWFPRSSMRSRSGNASLVLNHCNPGVIYCVCGRLMTTDSAENRKYISSTLDSFSIPNFYIRKRQTTWSQVWQKPQDAKEYHTANQLAKKCCKREYVSIHDRYNPRQGLQEGKWSTLVALNKWLSRWTSLRKRTTVTKPTRKKSSSTVAIGGSTRMWHASIQYRQGMNPNLKVRCQQCNALSEQRTRSKKRRHKPLHPRLHGTGIQPGGSLITSTHLKNGMTTDNTGRPVFWVV